MAQTWQNLSDLEYGYMFEKRQKTIEHALIPARLKRFRMQISVPNDVKLAAKSALKREAESGKTKMETSTNS